EDLSVRIPRIVWNNRLLEAADLLARHVLHLRAVAAEMENDDIVLLDIRDEMILDAADDSGVSRLGVLEYENILGWKFEFSDEDRLHVLDVVIGTGQGRYAVRILVIVDPDEQCPFVSRPVRGW